MTNAAARERSCVAEALRIGQQLRRCGWRLATAESCTGGWIAKVITDSPGSSAWFEGGFVTYSNAAKQRQLGVTAELLQRYGAVSGETVAAMAVGALARSGAELALAVSGVAGPGGGSAAKPVGTVWLAWAQVVANDATAAVAPKTHCYQFDGGRDEVRLQAVEMALSGLSALLASTATAGH